MPELLVELRQKHALFLVLRFVGIVRTPVNQLRVGQRFNFP